MSEDMRELSPAEINSVSGAFAPIVGYYALRTGGGALIGAGAGIVNELRGDGLQWSDAGSIGGWALAGAGFGGGGAMFRHGNRLFKQIK